MRPPDEWINKFGGKDGARKVWRLTQSLYGRRTAGAQFRDLFEMILCSEPFLGMVRGQHEPCGFFGKEAKILTFHHVDDGRIAGGHEAFTGLFIHFTGYLLLKVGNPIQEGDAYTTYLRRKRIRIKNGWVKVPDLAVIQKILSTVPRGQMPEGVCLAVGKEERAGG